MQKQSDGKWVPVTYYNQTTNKAEMNYHSFELKMLAIIRAIERFHIYLYRIEFTIMIATHFYAMNKANLNSRIARWTLSLQNYRFKLTQKRHGYAALSRAIAYVNAMPLERELKYRQLQDYKGHSERTGISRQRKIRIVYRKALDSVRVS